MKKTDYLFTQMYALDKSTCVLHPYKKDGQVNTIIGIPFKNMVNDKDFVDSLTDEEVVYLTENCL